jgi:hypothetical protein
MDMRTLPILMMAALAACQPKTHEVTVTVRGAASGDLEAIRAELGRLAGVTAVTTTSLKDGQAVFGVSTMLKGGELAAAMTKGPGSLREVKGFDDGSVQVAFGGATAPAGEPPAAPAAKPPATAPTPTPAPAPAAAPGKEVKVNAGKDPLACKIHQLPGGTIATFDGWKIQSRQDGNWIILATSPEGKENDFQMVIFLGTPTTEELEQLFTLGPARVRQMFPGFRPRSDGKQATFGGDPALVETYDAEWQGNPLTARVIYVRRKDVAVAVLGIGTEEAFKIYGRAVEITAQSITTKESPLEPAICGTWVLDSYKSTGTGSTFFSHSSSTSLTLYPNGTFTKSSMSSASIPRTDMYLEGGDRGTVVKRGNTLTFRSDKGEVWNAEYRLDGGGKALWLNQAMYLRQ